jgi:uncharacterized repeat protein (TIGR01451 family)
VSATNGATRVGSVLTWPVIPSLGAGSVQTYGVTVRLPVIGTFTNIAAGISTTADPNAANNNGSSPTGRVVTVVSGLADVVATKSGPATTAPGGTVTYSITVSNAGPGAALSVVVTDTLPPAATFGAASGGAVRAGNVLTWPTIASLPAGASTVYTVTVTAPTAGTMTNVVAATSATADPIPANNGGAAAASRVVTQVVAVADVAVAKTGPTSASIGAALSYTIVVSNAGPGAATSVVVTDTLPPGMTFVSATGGGTLSGDVVTWPTILSLASGASQTLSVAVRAGGAGALGRARGRARRDALLAEPRRRWHAPRRHPVPDRA